MTEGPLPVSLTTLRGGAAVELFDRELQRVAENILDPNTPIAGAREVRLVVKIKPTEDRESAHVTIYAEAKLQRASGAATRLFFGRRLGRPCAVEVDPNQGTLFDDEAAGPVGVVRLDGNGGKK